MAGRLVERPPRRWLRSPPVAGAWLHCAWALEPASGMVSFLGFWEFLPKFPMLPLLEGNIWGIAQ